MDLCVITFDLLIFTKVITLSKETPGRRIGMYAACVLLMLAYFGATFFGGFPASTASTLFVTLPSLLLFLCLSKYKDARFFLTFCFIDTCAFILTFIGRYISVLTGTLGWLVSFLAVFLICLAVYIVGGPYFGRYAKLLEHVSAGWSSMMACSILIYFALIFIAAYPKPLAERVEYGPVYLVFSAVCLSCYAVFIDSIIKNKKIYDQNLQLQKEKRFQDMAYTDALTGIYNRAAYMEKLNTLERERTPETAVCLILFDMDGLKAINDTLGHQSGDAALREAARLLAGVFTEADYSLFRIGGDEFVVIAENQSEQAVKRKVLAVENCVPSRIPYRLSAGYDFVGQSGGDTLEKAFHRADKKMYARKTARRGDPIRILPNENHHPGPSGQ